MWARRVVVVVVVVAQLVFAVRAYWAPHRELGFQMFPESSTWQAEIVRVTDGGDRHPVDEPWFGYEWNTLVGGRGLSSPWRRHHADSGIRRQLAFLEEALAWVADNTPADTETRYLEATVTAWRNLDPPVTTVVRSPDRALP